MKIIKVTFERKFHCARYRLVYKNLYSSERLMHGLENFLEDMSTYTLYSLLTSDNLLHGRSIFRIY